MVMLVPLHFNNKLMASPPARQLQTNNTIHIDARTNQIDPQKVDTHTTNDTQENTSPPPSSPITKRESIGTKYQGFPRPPRIPLSTPFNEVADHRNLHRTTDTHSTAIFML